MYVLDSQTPGFQFQQLDNLNRLYQDGDDVLAALRRLLKKRLSVHPCNQAVSSQYCQKE